MFKGLGNLGNIASMMGSLQSLPQKIEELNERMKSERVVGSSSCGKGFRHDERCWTGAIRSNRRRPAKL